MYLEASIILHCVVRGSNWQYPILQAIGAGEQEGWLVRLGQRSDPPSSHSALGANDPQSFCPWVQ